MIEPVTIVMGVAALGVASFFIARSGQRARLRTWLHAARSCGIEGLSPAEVVGFPTEVTGTKDGLTVKIERYSHGKYTRGTRIIVSRLDAVAPLRLHVEDFGTAIRKGLGKTEVQLGDPTFDNRFLIDGPAPLALSVLDAATRQLVWSVMGGRTAVQGSAGEAIESQAQLQGATLTVEFADTFTGSKAEERLPGLLGTILELAANLAALRDVPRQMAENALHDPLWAVRLANLRTLARECRTHPETARMLHGACSDPSEEIRLTAALALGGEGTDTLLQLAFDETPDEIAARAIAALGNRLPPERAVRALSEALAHERLDTACALMEALSHHEGGVAGAEPHLIRAVDHGDPRVRVTAAHALGRVGTVTAVLPMQQAAERFGGELRSVTRQAVAQIQARAVGAMPGQLTLSASGEGHVSLADDASGRVSLPEKRSSG
jgi:HEAT repeat protein